MSYEQGDFLGGGCSDPVHEIPEKDHLASAYIDATADVLCEDSIDYFYINESHVHVASVTSCGSFISGYGVTIPLACLDLVRNAGLHEDAVHEQVSECYA